MKSYYGIKEYDELKKELENYKKIFSDYIYSYFEELISLEKSAIDKIINDEVQILSQLPFYKSVVKYNIYNYALNILKKQNIKIEKFVDSYKHKKIEITGSLKLNNSPRVIKVLSLSINENSNIEVQLFNSLSDNEVKEKELVLLQNQLDKEIENANKKTRGVEIWSWHNYPVLSNCHNSNCDYEDPKEKYKKAIKKINSRIELSKNDHEEITTANKLYNLLLDEFGINDDNFIYEKTEYITGASHKYMNKVKTKTKANIKIISNNYYL